MATRTRGPDVGATWAQIGGAIGAPVGAALAALLVLLDWISAELGAAVLTGLSVGAPVGAIIGLVLSWRRTGGSPVSADATSAELDTLVPQLRSAVINERLSDRSSLINRLGGELNLAMRTIVREPGNFAGWRLSDRTSVRLERLPQHFLRHRMRLVLLGEPGSGKSLAALRILEHINKHEVGGRIRLAEAFPLASWGAWHVAQPDDSMTEWMANTLALQWGLSLGTARRLVASDVLIPIFDGLDEVEKDARKSCVLALNSYIAARTDRAFLICCRAKEYQELAPAWVAPEDRAELVIQSLELHEILKFLDRIPLGGPWQLLKNEIRAAALSSSPQGGQLADHFHFLRTPLHLTVALRTYVDDDPHDLLNPDPGQARTHLWEKYLARTLGERAPYMLPDAQRWLATMARLMIVDLEGSPVFWLHWLHWIDPNESRLRSARRKLGLAGVLVGGLIGALLRMNDIALIFLGYTLPPGYQIAIGAILGGYLGSQVIYNQPTRFHWHLWFRPSLSLIRNVVTAFLFWGAIAIYVAGPRVGLLTGALIALTMYIAAGGGSLVDDKILDSMGSRGPYAILRGAVTSGCIAFFAAYALYVLTSFILRPLVDIDTFNVFWFLFVGIGALYLGLYKGWDAVIWHFWLRLVLAREKRLPWRLVDFLRWASLPEREWVFRVGGSYRFRHREFQEFLAD